MAEAAQRRTKNRPNVFIHTAAVEAFPLNRSECDVVLCHQVFPHFKDKAHVLNLFSHALKPEGKCIIFHFINFVEINDWHRKAGTAVEQDIMPDEDAMRVLFARTGLSVLFIQDDNDGYFLSARLTRKDDDQ